MDDSIQRTLDEHVLLESDDLVNADCDKIQNSLAAISHDQCSTDVKCSILFKESMTLTVLKRFLNELQIFLQPLSEFLQFLAYFHFHSCEIFSKHLKEKSIPIEHTMNPDITVNQVCLCIQTSVVIKVF